MDNDERELHRRRLLVSAFSPPPMRLLSRSTSASPSYNNSTNGTFRKPSLARAATAGGAIQKRGNESLSYRIAADAGFFFKFKSSNSEGSKSKSKGDEMGGVLHERICQGILKATRLYGGLSVSDYDGSSWLDCLCSASDAADTLVSDLNSGDRKYKAESAVAEILSDMIDASSPPEILRWLISILGDDDDINTRGKGPNAALRILLNAACPRGVSGTDVAQRLLQRELLEPSAVLLDSPSNVGSFTLQLRSSEMSRCLVNAVSLCILDERCVSATALLAAALLLFHRTVFLDLFASNQSIVSALAIECASLDPNMRMQACSLLTLLFDSKRPCAYLQEAASQMIDALTRDLSKESATADEISAAIRTIRIACDALGGVEGTIDVLVREQRAFEYALLGNAGNAGSTALDALCIVLRIMRTRCEPQPLIDVCNTLERVAGIIETNSRVVFVDGRGLRVAANDGTKAPLWHPASAVLSLAMRDAKSWAWLLSQSEDRITRLIPYIFGLNDEEGAESRLVDEREVSQLLNQMAKVISDPACDVSPNVRDALCAAAFDTMERFSYMGSWEGKICVQKASIDTVAALCALCMSKECFPSLMRIGLVQLLSAHAFSSFHFVIGDELTGSFVTSSQYGEDVIHTQCRLLHEAVRAIGYAALMSASWSTAPVPPRVLKTAYLLLRRIVRPFELCQLELLEQFEAVVGADGERSGFVSETYAACDLLILACTRFQDVSTIPRGRSSILRAVDICGSIVAGTCNTHLAVKALGLVASWIEAFGWSVLGNVDNSGTSDEFFAPVDVYANPRQLWGKGFVDTLFNIILETEGKISQACKEMAARVVAALTDLAGDERRLKLACRLCMKSRSHFGTDAVGFAASSESRSNIYKVVGGPRSTSEVQHLDSMMRNAWGGVFVKGDCVVFPGSKSKGAVTVTPTTCSFGGGDNDKQEDNLGSGKGWTISVWVKRMIVDEEEGDASKGLYSGVCSDGASFWNRSYVGGSHTLRTLVEFEGGDKPIALLCSSSGDTEAAKLGYWVAEEGAEPLDPEESAAGKKLRGTWHDSGCDLLALLPGWHHVVILGISEEKRVRYYVDGEPQGNGLKCFPNDAQTVSAFGNSFHDGYRSPLGALWTAADMRVYKSRLLIGLVTGSPANSQFNCRPWGASSLRYSCSAWGRTCLGKKRNLEMLANALTTSDRSSPVYAHLLRAVANLTTSATNRDRLRSLHIDFAALMQDMSSVGAVPGSELSWIVFAASNLSEAAPV